MPDSPPQRLTDLLALSHVPRWTIVDTLRSQSVSDHTFRTLVIAWELSDRLKCPMSPGAVLYIVCHDAAECRTGDIPSTAKDVMAIGNTSKYCPWFDAPVLSHTELMIVKMADLIEAVTFIGAYGRGAHASRVNQWLSEKIYDLAKKLDPHNEVISTLISDITGETGRHP